MESGPATKGLKRGMLGIFLLGIVIPSAGIMVTHFLLPGRMWIQVPLHSAMVAFGSFAALSLAALLLFLRKHDRGSAEHVWISCGLLAMGILDGLHAMVMPGASSVWLHGTATLIGGFLFALVWLPAGAAKSLTADLLPVATTVAVAVFGLFSVAFPASLPEMITLDGYTPAGNATAFLGGGLFLAAAPYFVSRYRTYRHFEEFLFASLCLLFGLSGIMFPFSTSWFADSWFWHLLRLVAVLHILCYMFFVYQQTLTELKALTETLEQRVSERTAQLLERSAQLSQQTMERAEAEKALRKSEARYRRLLESQTDYIYSVQVEDGRPSATKHGPGCVATTGYTPGEFVADPGLWLRMVHEEDRRAVLDQLAMLFGGKAPFPLEYRIMHKDGRLRWIKNTPVPHFDREKRLVAYDGLVSDITERKKAEEALIASNEELSAINRVVTAYKNILDLREILAGVLEETLKIVGLEEGSICLLAPDGGLQLVAHRGSSRMAVIDIAHQLMQAGECSYGICARELTPLILPDREAVLRFATSEESRLADIRFHAAFPLVTPRGKCVGVLCAFTATDRKPTAGSLRLLETVTAHVALLIESARLHEEALSNSATLEKKVGERTMELEEANRKLKELDRLKSMFIASMSHELRTPLNSVIGFSSIILDEWLGPLNDEQKDNLAIVLRAGRYLLALINDVIDVSKIEAGQVEVLVEEFDLRELLAEAVTTLGKGIRGKGLELQFDGLGQMIRIDRRRLLQCVLNLLSNAAKYTERGFVRIAARKADGDFVEISVEDSGIGIKEKDKARIFEPFVRLESPLRTKVYGTGLGLYLTRKLVTEVLRGKIDFTSEYGRGSRFMIAIPVILNSGQE